MKRFLITNREGVQMASSCDGLADALESARNIKFSNQLTGPSDVYVVDSTGLVQPINIP
jgi:hypothetical protein